MHILYLTSWYPDEKSPNRGGFFREQAEAMLHNPFVSKVGVIDLKTIALRRLPSWLNESPIPRFSMESGVQVARARVPLWQVAQHKPILQNICPLIVRVADQVFDRAALRLFNDYCLRHGKPDLVHVQSSVEVGTLPLVIKREMNIPYTVQEHSSFYSRRLVSHEKKKRVREIFKCADYAAVVSKRLGSSLSNELDLDESLFNVQGNSISFLFEPDLPAKDRQPFVFLHISGLNKNKNAALILKSFAASKAMRESELWIGGHGPQAKALRRLAQRLGIESKVKFLGQLSRTEVVETMDQSHAFLLSSTQETFGIVLIEAMARGLICVSTDADGPQDTITDVSGLLVDRSSDLAFTEAIDKIRTEYDQFDVSRIRSEALRQFSSSSTTLRWIEIYQRILKHAKA